MSCLGLVEAVDGSVEDGLGEWWTRTTSPTTDSSDDLLDKKVMVGVTECVAPMSSAIDFAISWGSRRVRNTLRRPESGRNRGGMEK